MIGDLVLAPAARRGLLQDRQAVHEIGGRRDVFGHGADLGPPAVLELADHFRQFRIGAAQDVGRFRDGRRLVRHDRHFLHGHGVLFVAAAREHVGRGQRNGADLARIQVAVLRHVQNGAARPHGGQGNAVRHVAAQFRFIRRAVQFDQGFVQPSLVQHVQSTDLRQNDVLRHLHRFIHAVAVVPGRVAVAQDERLVLSGRDAGGRSRSSHYAVFRDQIHLQQRLALAVDQRAGFQVFDFRTHSFAPTYSTLKSHRFVPVLPVITVSPVCDSASYDA